MKTEDERTTSTSTCTSTQTSDSFLVVENVRRFRLPKPSHDPFQGDTDEPGIWEYVKMYLLGIVIIPVRVVLLALLLLLLNIYCIFCAMGCNLKYDGEDHIPERVQKMTRPAICFSSRAIDFILGCYYFPAKGQRADPKDVPIIVMNHISYYEAFYTIGLGFCHIGKKSAAQMLPFRRPATFLHGVYCEIVIETIQVERGDTASANRSREKIMAWLNHRHENNYVPFACYPEGTTTTGRCILRFKTGAFQPGLPVQPLVFKTWYIFFNPSDTFDCKYWLWRMLSQLICFFQAEYLPPYYPNDEEKKDAKLYALNVREYMCAATNLHMSEFSNHDVLLQNEAMKCGAKASKYSVEWGMFSVNFGLNFTETKSLVNNHALASDRTTGTWSEETFRKCMPRTLQDASPKLFSYFDQDGDGFISFRDYLWSACVLKKECKLTFRQLLGDESIDTPTQHTVSQLVEEALILTSPS
eukprot:gene935-4189_t